MLRQRWVGTPSFPPSGAVRKSKGKTTVYASWNGATLVAVRKVRDNESVILAIVEGGEPYVTWRMDTKTGDTYWGHYFHFSAFAASYEDFVRR